MARPFGRLIAGVLLLVAAASAAQARDALGVWEDWAAFRDPAVPRCYAIAMAAGGTQSRELVPFMTVGTWPARNVRGEVHWRLSRRIAPGSKVVLSLDGEKFELLASEASAWAQDRRMDAAIIAKMRAAPSLAVSGKSRDGRTFRDGYALPGAASALDAATLGCAGQP